MLVCLVSQASGASMASPNTGTFEATLHYTNHLPKSSSNKQSFLCVLRKLKVNSSYARKCSPNFTIKRNWHFYYLWGTYTKFNTDFGVKFST